MSRRPRCTNTHVSLFPYPRLFHFSGSRVSAELGAELEEADYCAARDALVQQGVVATGRGRGGSVRRVLEADAALTLQTQEIPESDKAPKPKQETMTLAQARRAKTEIKTKK